MKKESGTSDGAKKGWETRKGGGSSGDEKRMHRSMLDTYADERHADELHDRARKDEEKRMDRSMRNFYKDEHEKEAGTSDGAKKGWETRKGGGSSAKPTKSPTRKKLELLQKKNPGESLISIHHKAQQWKSMMGHSSVDQALDDMLDMHKDLRGDTMSKKMKHAEDEAKKEAKHAEEEAKKEAKHSEDEAEDEAKKESEESEEEEEEESEAKKEADDEEDHDDEEQDKKLILQMIKKHMGEEESDECSEEEAEAMHQAYEAYKELGEEEDEAMKCAGKAMKLAKHMASKKQAEAEKCEDEAAPKKEKEVVPLTAKPEKHVKKESEIKLAARVAMLERELKKHELAKVLDKKLKESGLGRAETDKIRSLIGEPKSEEQIVETIKIFKEAFSVRGSESTLKKGNFFVTTERSETPAKKTGKVNFSDI